MGRPAEQAWGRRVDARGWRAASGPVGRIVSPHSNGVRQSVYAVEGRYRCVCLSLLRRCTPSSRRGTGEAAFRELRAETSRSMRVVVGRRPIRLTRSPGALPRWSVLFWLCSEHSACRCTEALAVGSELRKVPSVTRAHRSAPDDAGEVLLRGHARRTAVELLVRVPVTRRRARQQNSSKQDSHARPPTSNQLSTGDPRRTESRVCADCTHRGAKGSPEESGGRGERVGYFMQQTAPPGL
jgi:hypothetical protein